MKIKSGWLFLALAPTVSFGMGDDCKFSADRAAGIEASGVEKVIIRAGAGDMKVLGRANAVRIEARGVACAARQELLDATLISVRREGNAVIVETALPENLAGWTLGKNEYAYIDLGVALPANLPVEALDSSGDAAFEDLNQLTLQDSSGDLDVRRIAGLADISDSSGDIDVGETGNVRVRDSSGDMELRGVRGEVDIELDSSGDIRVLDVGGSVRVRQDSSGSIRIEDVKGNVDVDSDSSGDIRAARVGGHFTVREDSSGSIDHSAIGGKVTIPSNKRDEDVE
jgi:DUF4097 and DUF4098 domain-containing protein YvlB